MTSRFKRTGGSSVRNTSGVGPAHLNKVAFRPAKNSTFTKKVNAIGNGDVCQRCRDILEWRKNYRKFKLLKRPKKCTMCERPNVKCAYHVLCQNCSRANACCAKCKTPAPPNETFHTYDASPLVQCGQKIGNELVFRPEEEDPARVQQMLRNAPIQERERRSLLRELGNGTLTSEQIIALLT
jgi:hypothetical protein